MAVEWFVLVVSLLARAAFKKDAVGRHREGLCGRFNHKVAPPAVFVGVALVWSLVLGDVEVAVVPVDRKGEFGDVTVIDAKGGRFHPFRVLSEVFKSLLEAIGQEGPLLFPFVGRVAHARRFIGWRWAERAVRILTERTA